MKNTINTNTKLLICVATDGKIKLDVSLENETVWLTQAQMAELFGKSRSTISEHIKNVFDEGELEEKAMEKAKREYDKYQTQELNSIEKEYLNSKKTLNKIVEQNNV